MCLLTLKSFSAAEHNAKTRRDRYNACTRTHKSILAFHSGHLRRKVSAFSSPAFSSPAFSGVTFRQSRVFHSRVCSCPVFSWTNRVLEVSRIFIKHSKLVPLLIWIELTFSQMLCQIRRAINVLYAFISLFSKYLLQLLRCSNISLYNRVY